MARLVSLSLVVLAAGCAGTLNVRLASPAECKLVVAGVPEPFSLPATAALRSGRHAVELQVPEAYAKKLGADQAFSLYGYLTVSKPTENAKLTNVRLDVSDALLVEAYSKGRVVEAFTVDNEADRKLIALRLGQRKPD